MSFFGKINPFNLHHGLLHTIAKNPLLSKALPILLTLAGQPELAAASVAGESYASGQKPIKSILSGLTNYAGNAIGSSIGNSIFPKTIGSVLPGSATNALSDVAIKGAGGLVGTAANNILNTSIGGAIGGFAGGKLASDLTATPKAPAAPNLNPNSLLPAPFKPSNQPNIQVPGSLNNDQFSSLTPDQKTSNLATQGVYGGGNGPQEQQYFTQLVNNQLVDPSGKTGDMNSLSPIENSYLSQLGFGGYSNSNDLLGAISQWQKKQPQQAMA